MSPFRTHTGDIVTGELLQAACTRVAADLRKLAHDIRAEDAYASHVTEATKDANRDAMLARAKEIEAGTIDSFTVWQLVDTVLTGKSVPLLSATQSEDPRA